MALIAFVILFYSSKMQYKLFNTYIELLIMFFSLVSIVLSFSRTTYVLLIITLLVPYIHKKQILVVAYISSVVFVLFLIFGGLFLDQNSGGTQGIGFQSKIMHSLSEMIVRDYDNTLEINSNWRGFEAYLGLEKYYSGNPVELIVGQGYGTVVYTPYWVFGDADTVLDVLPMFHNGYITIILKTGILGLFLFFTWLYVLLRAGNKIYILGCTRQERLVGNLIQASVFIIFFQTLVVHGIFKTIVPVLLLVLIGISLQVYTNTKKKVAIL